MNDQRQPILNAPWPAVLVTVSIVVSYGLQSALLNDLGVRYFAFSYMALAAGRWSYTERMPVVPVLAAGLWPPLQMTLLPPLTFWIARWWAGRSAPKGSL